MSITSSVLGAAGEHFVMCQLLRRGLIAALAPAGVPNADLIVTDQLGSRLSAVQVKARIDKGGDGGWHMKEKHEDISSPTLFYVFVDFGKDLVKAPVCFVLPSAIVADVVKRGHNVWLATPGMKGQQRNTTVMRRFLPDFDGHGRPIGCPNGWLDPYREAWHLIKSGVETDENFNAGPHL
jgi:hypothetical protein